MVQRRSEEIIGYHFTVIHRSKKMTGDVDEITGRFGYIVSVYLCVAYILYDKDELKRPDSYDDAALKKGPTQLKNVMTIYFFRFSRYNVFEICHNPLILYLLSHIQKRHIVILIQTL